MSVVELQKKVVPAFTSGPRAAGVAQLSSEIPVDSHAVVSMLVDLTAIGGTPVSTALDAKLQYSPDVAGNRWYDLDDGAITQLTATGTAMVVNKPITFARRIRVSYTLAFSGGTTPTATFSIDVSLTNIGTSEVTLETGDMSIGAVELKDATASTRAKVVAGTSAAEGDNAVVTKDASVGLKADAALTDSTQSGTLIAFVKGLVKILNDVWDSTTHFLKVKELYQPGYEINTGTAPYARMRQTCSFSNITADTAVLSGSGFFYGFVCNSTSSGTVVFYDNIAASGTKILNTFTPVAGTVYILPAVAVANGIYADITSTLDITVLYAAS